MFVDPFVMSRKEKCIMKIRLWLIAGVLLVAGCKSTYQHQTLTATQAKLDRGGSAYVALPADGVYGETKYEGSGATTAQAVSAAFGRYLNRVETAKAVEPFEQNIARAQAGKFTYLVVPQILHWEDRATEWSMIRDKIEIKLQVVDAATTNALARVMFKGKSKLVSFGGDYPQDLLDKPVNRFVRGLFE